MPELDVKEVLNDINNEVAEDPDYFPPCRKGGTRLVAYEKPGSSWMEEAKQKLTAWKCLRFYLKDAGIKAQRDIILACVDEQLSNRPDPDHSDLTYEDMQFIYLVVLVISDHLKG